MYEKKKKTKKQMYDKQKKRKKKKRDNFSISKFSPTQGNKPHKLCSYSLEARTEVYRFRLNFGLITSLKRGPH